MPGPKIGKSRREKETKGKKVKIAPEMHRKGGSIAMPKNPPLASPSPSSVFPIHPPSQHRTRWPVAVWCQRSSLSVCHRQIFWKPSMQVAKLGLAAPPAPGQKPKTDGRRKGAAHRQCLRTPFLRGARTLSARGLLQGGCLERGPHLKVTTAPRCDHGVAERDATERCRSRISEPFLGAVETEVGFGGLGVASVWSGCVDDEKDSRSQPVS